MALKAKRELRQRLNQSGWVTLDGGFAARSCMVIDRSSTGAKIVVEDPSGIQKNFKLAFTRDSRTGMSCAVVWRRGKTLGIKFIR